MEQEGWFSEKEMIAGLLTPTLLMWPWLTVKQTLKS